MRRQFASDNYSGICPDAWRALADANTGHAIPYGEDEWTERAADAVRRIFETDCEVFFVFNGTAANSLAISHCCQPYNSVVCAATAHIETDECGAPEFFSNGCKLLHVSTNNGKIEMAAAEEVVERRDDIHYPKPRMLSLTQTTECGTIYSLDELRAAHEVALRHRLRVHMDGARFANAVASLDLPPKEITWKIGVDVLCLGCTKNGAAAGEAVIFFDKDLARDFDYRCKQAGQLASKMRFLSAPLAIMLESGIWLRNAQHANNMAKILATELAKIGFDQFLFPVEANAVFLKFPPEVDAYLHNRGWRIYSFIGGGHRLMCSWDTTRDDIDSLIAGIKAAQGAPNA